MDPIPFRIKIGVTGHRKNLPDGRILKKSIRDALGIDEWTTNKIAKNNSVFSLFDDKSIDRLKEAKSTPIAFNVMTALAEGADRITAETILETQDATIHAVLPLTEEDYLNDFETQESKSEFHRLLKLDFKPYFLRIKNLSEVFPVDQLSEQRRQAYYNAGRYIVDHCDVLIAVWNGEPAQGKGGTAEIIAYAEKKKRPVIIISSKDPGSIQIKKHRELNAEQVKQLDFFNSCNFKQEEEKRYVENIYNEYFSNINESKVLKAEMTNFLKSELLPYYAKASVVAKKYQSLFKKSGLYAYIFSAIAITTLVIAVIFNILHQYAYVIEFVLMLVIFLLIGRAQRVRAHRNWLENRFLVERIRVAPYFFLCGQSPRGARVSKYDVEDYAPPWMALAFEEIWNRVNLKWYNNNKQQFVKQPFSTGYMNYIKKSWVTGQISYHAKAQRINSGKNMILKKTGMAVFFTAMIFALLHIVLSLCENKIPHCTIINKALIVLLLSLPFIAVAMEGIRRQREYSHNSMRNEKMLIALSELSKRYDEIDSEQEFNDLLRVTDDLMLIENQDWLMLMIPAELEFPA